MYKKKLTDKEFAKMMVNKQLEIAGVTETDFDKIIESKDKDWFDRYALISRDQYEEFEKFYYDHFYDWQPKSVSKERMEKEFSWWMLQYGLRYDFGR